MPWARARPAHLPDLLYLVKRYHVRVGDGYAPTGHEPRGEHPLGLAVDLTPGPGGSWREVARLASWAEPRQNHPRPPFRWVGWTGDRNHGSPRPAARADCPAHLHLSWAHSPGAARPVVPCGPSTWAPHSPAQACPAARAQRCGGLSDLVRATAS